MQHQSTPEPQQPLPPQPLPPQPPPPQPQTQQSNPLCQMNNMSSETIGSKSESDMDFLNRPFSTLDEPVMETVMRDVRSVVRKLKVVVMPLEKLDLNYESLSMDDELKQTDTQKEVLNQLKEWDLWGPLVVCMLLSILLSIRAPANQASGVFAYVFCSMWIGSAVVTLNAKLLGGTISFFQSVCVLGYCVFPFVLSATMILALSQVRFFNLIWIRSIWVLIGFIWSTRVSKIFIGQYIKKERRVLAVFPVLFYYAFIGWLVLLF